MDKDYLPFHPSPSKPQYVAPAGAVDAHCHVFGPAISSRIRRSANTRRVMRQKISCLHCAIISVLHAM